MKSKVPISVIIPVRNEQANLRRCLEAVAWAAEIFVVDSQSTDETVAIAESFGARVVQFHFNGTWPKKKNWALDNLPFAHEWVLIVDADEVMPAGAEGEVAAVVTGHRMHAGYWINRRFMFMGRWLRHAYYPNWNLRLFKHRLGRYEKITDTPTGSGDNEVHEHVVVRGTTDRLGCEMDHYAFPSVEVFVEKHNRYSNWEARVALEPELATAGLQSRAVQRRRTLKRWARRLPCRPLLRFLYVYFGQRGFLDGREGYYFARLHATYELMSEAKTFELAQERSASKVCASAPKLSFNQWLMALFVPCFFAGCFFILRPSPHGERVAGLPIDLGRWINGHDGLANLIGFGVLALLWMFVHLPAHGHGGPIVQRMLRGLEPRRRRMAAFALFGVWVEFAQFCIPGRVYDLRDVMVSWLAAGLAGGVWAVHRWLTKAQPESAFGSAPDSGPGSVGEPTAGEAMKHVTIWGINFAPELTGIGPYNKAVCDFLQGRGHDVRMVTSFPYYPGWQKRPEDKWKLFQRERVEGTTVHRCWHFVPRQPSTVLRMLHEGTFVLSSFLRLLFLPRPDLLFVVSPPLLLGLAARCVSWFKGCPYLFHVQDLQPDAAAELGMVRSRGLLALLRSFERGAYRSATWVSGISKGMLEAFRRKGVSETKLLYLPNPILPGSHATAAAPGRFRLRHGFRTDDFVAIYSGNLGRKQGLDILVQAASQIKNPKLRIVICGDGSYRSVLEGILAEASLKNISLLPLQAPSEYAELMADMDLCLITQLAGSGRCFLPSKLLAALAAGKPVLAVADADSDLVNALREGNFGIDVRPDDAGNLAARLDALAEQTEQLERMGRAARAYAQVFDLDAIFSRLDDLLQQCGTRERRTLSFPEASSTSSSRRKAA